MSRLAYVHAFRRIPPKCRLRASGHSGAGAALLAFNINKRYEITWFPDMKIPANLGFSVSRAVTRT
jgi:hypothetical protein